MTYRGHVKNGQIKLDDPARLPEGAQVNVEVLGDVKRSNPTRHVPARKFKPIEMPGGSLAEELIRDRR